MSNTKSMLSPDDTVISKRSSGILFILGVSILVIGFGTTFYAMNNNFVILFSVFGVILIIFSFIYPFCDASYSPANKNGKCS